MAMYYFDLETTGIDPDNDKIITINLQRVDDRKIELIGEVEILKEWESSEEQIVRDLYTRFFENKSMWDFIILGNNLNFEFEFLKSKFKKYLGVDLNSRDLHYSRPHIDIKPILVMLNNLEFKGAKLTKFTGKEQEGDIVKEYYQNKQYDKIENYVEEEVKEFFSFFKKINLILKGGFNNGKL